MAGLSLGNYTLTDGIHLSIALLIWPLFSLIPGFVLGWALNFLDFRRRRLITRLLIGIALSVSVFPVVTYLSARVIPFQFVWFLYIPFWIFFGLLMMRQVRLRQAALNPYLLGSFGLIMIWMLVAGISLVDIQLGDRLYFNVHTVDYRQRVSLTDAIVRTGIPPTNPHFYPGQPLKISYYYFWSMMAALVSSTSNGVVDSRDALNASTIWSGIALCSAAALFLRFSMPKGKEDIERRSLTALGLFFVTGLELLMILRVLPEHTGNAFITEWWNGNYLIATWLSVGIWAPMHLTSLVVGIMAFMALQQALCGRSKNIRVVSIILAGLSLSSALGMSVYVTLVMGIFVFLWFLQLLLVQRNVENAGIIFWSGVLALIITLPYAIETIANRQAVPAAPISFTVRPLESIQWLWEAWGLGSGLRNLLNFLLLPVNYCLELGFILVAGLLFFENSVRQRLGLTDQYLLLGVSILVPTFLQSSLSTTNDLGWRSFLPAQFILLIWATEWTHRHLFRRTGAQSPDGSAKPSRMMVWILWGMLVIGLLGSVFNLAYQRLFFILGDQRGWMTIQGEYVDPGEYGKRTLALRQAYDFIHANTATQAVLQYDVDKEGFTWVQGAYGMRQSVIGGEDLMRVYGVDPSDMQKVTPGVNQIFSGDLESYAEVRLICEQTQIDYLLVTDVDAAWTNYRSWVWHGDPIYKNDFVRVFACR